MAEDGEYASMRALGSQRNSPFADGGRLHLVAAAAGAGQALQRPLPALHIVVVGKGVVGHVGDKPASGQERRSSASTSASS